MPFDPFEPGLGVDKPVLDPLKAALPSEAATLAAALSSKYTSSTVAGIRDDLRLTSKLGLQTPLLDEILKPKANFALASLLTTPGDIVKSSVDFSAFAAGKTMLSSPTSDILKNLDARPPKLTLGAALPKPLGTFAFSETAALAAAIQPKASSLLTGSINAPLSPLLSDLLKPALPGPMPLDLLPPIQFAVSPALSSVVAQWPLGAAFKSPSELLEPLVGCVPKTMRLPEVLEASRLTKLMGELLSPKTIMPLSLSTPFQSLQKDFQSVGDGYSAFLHSVPVHDIEPTLFPIPSRSYFQSGDLILELPAIPTLTKPLQRARESTRSDLRIYAENRLAPFLDKLNPRLRKMWEGAHAAAASNNPDKVRHAMISLRELFTQVIHTLAPDAEVKGWTSDNQHFHRGRPTREARLLYICAPVADGPLSDFVVPDVRSVLALANVFQQGTHGVDVAISPVQLRLIFRRLEGALCNLIDIRTASQ